jgi:DNA-binding MarR family transcriptional regulator
MGLSPAARRVLATLAVVGRASLSEAELAALVEVADVAPLIEELERRGLIERDRRERYSVLERIGEPLRKADEATASADRLLQYLTTLAKAGELTPGRLAEDADAILGLSEWAATSGRWATVLELVKGLQACFRIGGRVQEWLALLEHGRSAARALGDTQNEVWMLQQLASASASAGDADAARRYSHEADELQRRVPSAAQRTARLERSAADARTVVAESRSLPRLALWLVSLIVVGGAGIGAGYALGNDSGAVGATTEQVKVTATVRGQATTATKTLTFPATTVTSTTTALQTTTETTTVTTTTTTAAGIP